MITDQSSDLRAGVPAQQPEPGESSTRPCRSKGYLPPLRPHPIVSLLSTPISILITSFVLFTSCTSPTPPPPPPPPAGPDTTSHDFIWQIDTLGDGNSSVLYDVAIINDTTIWAVGDIYLKDSTGQVDPNLYNVAVWNGSGWKCSRGPLSPFNAVFAFGPHDIWAGTSAPYHWNGASWTGYNVTGIFDGHIKKIWGTSSTDLYIVGTNGSIAHFDGTTWRRIESGTTLPINDVWGSFRSEANQTELIAVCADKYQDLGRKILRITPSGVEALSDSGLPWSLSGIWFASDGPCYAVGAGIASISELTSEYAWSVRPSGEINNYYSFAIRGNAPNDVFVAGAFGEILHFNGLTWRNYLNDTGMFFGNLYGVAQRGRLVVAVGAIPQRAIVIIGRR